MIRIVLVGLCALAIAMGIGRFVYTPLLPLMLADGTASMADGGLVASIHFLGYWLGAVFAARLPWSPRTVLRVSLIAIGASTLGMGLTEHVALWALLRWLAGLCSAFTLVIISNFTIKALADAGQAGKQGWVFSGVGAGIVFAGLGTLAIMAGGIGGAAGWLIFGVTSLLAAIAVSVGIGDEIAGSRATVARGRSGRTPMIWSIILPYGALGIGYIIPATYLPIMASNIVSDPLVFGWAWPVFGIAAFLSTLLAAGLQRRFSIRAVWAASQWVMALGLFLVALYPHIATMIAAGICVGGTFMIITMMGMKETHRVAPAHDVMRHLAAMTAAFACGQMIGPVLASSIYDLTQSFSASLLLAGVLLAASTWTLRRPAPPS